MSLKLAKYRLRVNHVDLCQPVVKAMLDLSQLLEVNLAVSPIKHAWDWKLSSAILKSTLHFLKEQVLILIREYLDSLSELNVILCAIMRYWHYKASVDISVWLH